jgi:hypothetical protein
VVDTFCLPTSLSRRAGHEPSWPAASHYSGVSVQHGFWAIHIVNIMVDSET